MLVVAIGIGIALLVVIILRLFDMKHMKEFHCSPTFFTDGEEHCFHEIEIGKTKIEHGKYKSTTEHWKLEECCNCSYKRTVEHIPDPRRIKRCD